MRPLAVACLSLFVAGCSSPGATTGPDASALTVFGAASLRDALDALAEAFREERPAVSITISTESSAALATQIEQGAPADVFLSADTTNAQRLVDDGLAAGDAIVFAANALVVVVPLDNPAGIGAPADLARPGLRVIAAGEAVPITRYAVQLVANLASLPGYPADFEAAYAANIVSREDNVRAVVAKVELGEGDAGIVYATDAAASERVEVVPVPERANVPALYAGVVIEASASRAVAASFLDWVAGPDGQAILADFGFRPAPS